MQPPQTHPLYSVFHLRTTPPGITHSPSQHPALLTPHADTVKSSSADESPANHLPSTVTLSPPASSLACSLARSPSMVIAPARSRSTVFSAVTQPTPLRGALPSTLPAARTHQPSARAERRPPACSCHSRSVGRARGMTDARGSPTAGERSPPDGETHAPRLRGRFPSAFARRRVETRAAADGRKGTSPSSASTDRP